jgi:hypothetical protein
MDILGRPIQNQVKSAAKQIKASRNHPGKSKGGVIFLNTGYSSIFTQKIASSRPTRAGSSMPPPHACRSSPRLDWAGRAAP